MILVGGGLGAYFGLRGDDGKDGNGSSTVTTERRDDSEQTATTLASGAGMGKAEVKLPDPAKLIQTTALGEVPANQICVVLADGQKHGVAEDLAEALGGSVVGELEFMNAFQIETSGATEADLKAALGQALATAGVEIAFPNLQGADDTEIWGIRQSPLNDPAYGGGRAAGFELIGAPKAWTYMRGAGLQLNDVHVGVVDDGIYRGTGEFDGDASIYFPDPNAGELSDPNKSTNKDTKVTVDRPTGSHGTMVSGIIAGDPSNGGMTGLASPVLGNHLTVSMVNHQDSYYGNKPVANPDPNDPTVVTYDSGKSYSFGSLVALTKEIDAGAKVINCSWGTNMKPLMEAEKKYKNGEITQAEYDEEFASYEQTAKAYKKFFETMSTEHPEVLFVCSAGNDGWVMDGSIRWPSGLNLPNMVTVGNVMNDGSTADSSNKLNTAPGQEFEVTLAAPGQEVVQGVDADGNPVTNTTDIGNGYSYGGGTSAAAPQVAAAAALLLSLDPDLTAGEIKQILSDTARPGPAELGGKILAIDQAVLEVINQQRQVMGLPEVTGDELEKGGVIDAVATSQDEEGVWSVKAIVESLPSAEGAEITITATTGTKIEGQTTQKLTTPGEIVWVPVTIDNELAQITITRGDSGASTIIYFEAIDLNGYWEGTFTFGDFNIDQAALAAASEEGGEEGCSLVLINELLSKLQNRGFPMTMDITVDEDGNGTAIMTVDTSSIAAELAAENPDMEVTSDNEPQTLTFTFEGNTLTFQMDPESGATGSMVGAVRREGEDLVIDGTMSASTPQYTLTCTWTVTKQ